MHKWVADIEIFPGYFLLCARHYDTEEVRFFRRTGGIDELGELEAFLDEEVSALVFFNARYDANVLRFLYSKGFIIPGLNELYHFSNSLIEAMDQEEPLWKSHLAGVTGIELPFKVRDVYTLNHWDREFVSLKAVAVSIGWPVVQDLPKDPHERVEPEEYELIERYCLNDVDITREISKRSKKEWLSRRDAGWKYGIDVMSKSRSGVGDAILGKLYGSKPKPKRRPKKVKLGDVIEDKIFFHTDALNKALEAARAFSSYKKHKFEYRLPIGRTWYEIKEGGLHDQSRNLTFRSDDKHLLLDVDVASYYPSLMLDLGIYPRHLPGFLPLFRDIVNDRLLAKRNGNASDSGILKIVINAVFGKMGEENSWLYDRHSLLRVTMNGQFYLLMLIEALEREGIRVVYANTDGITMYPSLDQVDRAKQICSYWEAHTGMVLEYEKLSSCFNSNTNNYLWVYPDGSLKTKGSTFNHEPSMGKSFDRPVIAKAIVEYLSAGIPVDWFIETHGDVMDFCTYKKIGKSFDPYYKWIEGGSLRERKLQRTNRFIITRKGKGGALYKRRLEDHTLPNGRVIPAGTDSVAPMGKSIHLMNRVDSRNAMDYPVDYQHYIGEANKIIGKVTNGNQEELPFG